MNQVEVARRKLEIVKLRNLAAWQRGVYAANHYYQAEHPIYPGQEMICISKAVQAEGFASLNEARADLMEAELGGE